MKAQLLGLFLIGGLTYTVSAQENLKYQLPPQSIVDLVDAPSNPVIQFNKTGSIMLILQSPGFASIEDISQPVIGVAGLKVTPNINSTAA